EVAKAHLELAKAALAQAQAQTEQAQVVLTFAQQKLKDAQDKLAATEKGAKNAPPDPVKEGESFTLHVRLLDAPEKVTTLKADRLPVLAALGKAGDAVPLIRGPEGLSVWVVRDKALMPVDLDGIVNKGETKTNYVLKPGDRLFVQVKLGK